MNKCALLQDYVSSGWTGCGGVHIKCSFVTFVKQNFAKVIIILLGSNLCNIVQEPVRIPAHTHVINILSMSKENPDKYMFKWNRLLAE